jgi:hypothetical protein
MKARYDVNKIVDETAIDHDNITYIHRCVYDYEAEVEERLYSQIFHAICLLPGNLF